MDLSQSKIKTWRNCRKQYYYKYVMKITSKFKPEPLMRGSVLHEMLEAHYKGQDPWKKYKQFMKENEKAIRVHPEEYGHLPHNVKVMMEGYFDFYEDEKIKPLLVEYEFRTKLIDKIYLTGKIDMVAKEKKQKLTCTVEHKSHNTIPSGGMVPYANLQSSVYNWVLKKEEGMKIDGMMWNYILAKPPSVPQLLKNGEMSRRSSGTTWPVYLAELKKNKLNPKDYSDMKKSLKGNEENYYQRKIIPLSPTLIDNILEDTKMTAREIDKYAGIDQTRNLGRHCDYCEFKNLCIAQLKGLDDNYILKADFTKREKK